jgi:hypothetical protein
VKRIVAAGLVAVPSALAVVHSLAHAQVVPISPNVPPPPTVIGDPGAAPAPPVPYPTPTPEPQRPDVMIIGPDGKVTHATDAGSAAPREDGGNFIYPDMGRSPSPTDSADVTYVGITPDSHTVHKGDTLWDICVYYFNDPWQWPKIWSYNPQITNPHWIYPGDIVRLLPAGMITSAPSTSKIAPETEAPEPLPPPASRVTAAVRALAFVEQGDLDSSIEIAGAPDEKILLGIHDDVYLSYPEGKPPEVGKQYSIYVPDNSVKDHGKKIGAYVHVLGTLEVTSVKTDKRARATILEASQEIERGLKVGPLAREFTTLPPVPAAVDAQGEIVAKLARSMLIGSGEVVFVNLGKDSGLEVGNRMAIVRRGDAYPKNMQTQTGQDNREFPARALGEIQIVEIGDRISVGLVTMSVQETTVGDLVMMQKAR